jgi:hydroxyethylthiazole kinase-like uncharacterized protein yjeF
MIVAHTVEEIRAAEAALMARLPDGALMQRAASGLAAICARVLNSPYGARIVMLVGGGNNGGDALWAGAKLATRGARVDAVLLRPDRAHGEGLAAFKAAGGRVATDNAFALIERSDVVIDGIYGIGGRPGLDDASARLAAHAHENAGLVIAVDVPSGIDPDSGESPGASVIADITVTFGTYKTGLLVDPGAAAAGRVELVDIGLRSYLGTPVAEALVDDEVAELLPVPGRNADKFRRGVVGVLAGSEEYRGAAVLAAGGAVRGGAGMVRFAGSDVVANGVRARWPEVVVSDTVENTGRVQSWVAGPGLGDEGARGVEAVVRSGLSALIDADGLRSIPSRFTAPTLLTPHAGELAGLLDVERSDVEARRLHYARSAAERWQATVLLKGSTTIVVAPGGRTRVNRTGTSALATAGSGDVLAGLAGALLASGLSPLDAGSVAAHIHGLAGQLAARLSGYPTATDILEALPVVLASLPT